MKLADSVDVPPSDYAIQGRDPTDQIQEPDNEIPAKAGSG